MDRKTIEKYGTDIYCYRLRTARQKKRMQYEDFDKWLIRQDRALRDIDEQIAALGWKPLDPPVQKGWKRSFVLREDVARSDKAALYSEILQTINTVEWSYRKDFKVRKREKGRKRYVVSEQRVKYLYEEDFQRNKLSEAQKLQFVPELRFGKGDCKPWLVFVFKEPWRFVLQVKPNMVDKQRVIDPDLESRYKQIENHIDRSNYRHRLNRISYGRGWHWSEYPWRRPEENPLKNKPIHRILDLLKEESI